MQIIMPCSFFKHFFIFRWAETRIGVKQGVTLNKVYPTPLPKDAMKMTESIYKFGLSVCLFVSNKRQNG